MPEPVSTTALVLVGLSAAAAKKGVDVLAQFTQEFFGPSLKALGEGTAEPIKEWAALRALRTRRRIEEAAAMLDAVGIQAQTVPGRILLPLAQYSSLEEDPELQQKWAALLANAASDTASNKILPGYVEILRQPTPIQARILDWIHAQRQVIDNQQISPHLKNQEFWPQINLQAILAQFPELNVVDYLLLVTDLDRLGLVEHIGLHDDTLPQGYQVIGFTRLCMHFLFACTPPARRNTK